MHALIFCLSAMLHYRYEYYSSFNCRWFRRTWTSLRLLLFSEPRRPLKFGRKPLRPGHRQWSLPGVKVAAFLRKRLQLQLRSRSKSDETALGVLLAGVRWMRLYAGPLHRPWNCYDAIKASNNKFSAKGCNYGLHARSCYSLVHT
jgi:hypothetical protein